MHGSMPRFGRILLLVLFLAYFLPLGWALAGSPASGTIVYPETRKGDVVDEYQGLKVPDPYRWLEDPDAPESRVWIEAQNKISFGYLEAIPQREAIKDRLTELWNYERYGAPFKKAGRYFFFKNDGLQNHGVLYTTNTLDGKPRVLIDPNTFSPDGTVALNRYAIGAELVSPDGRLMVYGISESGSDWADFKIRHIDKGQDLKDHLEWVKFSGASWTKDSRGFFYARFDEPKDGDSLTASNYFQKLYYHRLGTPQSQDELIFARTKEEEKDWSISGNVTEDGRYLIIPVRRGTERKNRVFYRDLQAQGGKIVGLINEFEALQEFIGNDGSVFWFRSFQDAPHGRVIAIDIRKPDKASWKEIIPETKNTLKHVSVLNDMFVCTYLKDACTQVMVFDLKGRFVREVRLPGLGTAGGFGGERTDTETFYRFTSFTTPRTVFRYDLTTGESTVYRKPNVNFNSADYETKQVFYHSKDGTRVPMFITYKKGIKLDGNNPTYLYGYGGFNISMTPWFSVSSLVWMEMGGVLAVPNIRGGGEYGQEWHEAGCKLKRQNVFDDFLAAAEWLIENKYTSTPKLAIGGASNGGLLVGVCMTQRPDLFGACLPDVGVLDMLRFHKFTIGHAWVSDYGCADNPEEFKALYAYSPLHNCRPGTAYPATMITTADHDDRVVPAHSFKFAATLQAAHSGPAPVLIRIETKAGHGSGKPTTKRIEEAADKWAFLIRVLKVKPQ